MHKIIYLLTCHLNCHLTLSNLTVYKCLIQAKKAITAFKKQVKGEYYGNE